MPFCRLEGAGEALWTPEAAWLFPSNRKININYYRKFKQNILAPKSCSSLAGLGSGSGCVFFPRSRPGSTPGARIANAVRWGEPRSVSLKFVVCRFARRVLPGKPGAHNILSGVSQDKESPGHITTSGAKHQAAPKLERFCPWCDYPRFFFAILFF